MKPRTGGATLTCAWMMMLWRSTAAALPSKTHARSSCDLKALAALTRSLQDETLARFEEANGKDFGIWFPGFPDLQVHENSPINGPKVQCSLIFAARGMEEILEDQRDNLNPADAQLHEMIRDTTSMVLLLTHCVRDVLGGSCSLKPRPLKLPEQTFERKQWSHTFLQSARYYSGWLKHKFWVKSSKGKYENKIIHKESDAKLHKKFNAVQ